MITRRLWRYMVRYARPHPLDKIVKQSRTGAYRASAFTLLSLGVFTCGCILGLPAMNLIIGISGISFLLDAAPMLLILLVSSSLWRATALHVRTTSALRELLALLPGGKAELILRTVKASAQTEGISELDILVNALSLGLIITLTVMVIVIYSANAPANQNFQGDALPPDFLPLSVGSVLLLMVWLRQTVTAALLSAMLSLSRFEDHIRSRTSALLIFLGWSLAVLSWMAVVGYGLLPLLFTSAETTTTLGQTLFQVVRLTLMLIPAEISLWLMWHFWCRQFGVSPQTTLQ